MSKKVKSQQEIFGKKLKQFRKKCGLSQIDTANELTRAGLPIKAGAISTWETGASLPSSAQFLELCKLYGITDIYQQFIDANSSADPMFTLSEEGRAKVLDYIHLLEVSGEYQKAELLSPVAKSASKSMPQSAPIPIDVNDDSIFHNQYTRTIKLYTLPASAGTGEFLDDDDYETVVIGNEVPDSADFGVRIHGDSMEPLFINGQVVFVHRTDTLRDGDIGIFYLDGNAYCKKLKEGRRGISLISLNKKYSPIKIDENSDFRVFGRVVA